MGTFARNGLKTSHKDTWLSCLHFNLRMKYTVGSRNFRSSLKLYEQKSIAFL